MKLRTLVLSGLVYSTIAMTSASAQSPFQQGKIGVLLPTTFYNFWDHFTYQASLKGCRRADPSTDVIKCYLDFMNSGDQDTKIGMDLGYVAEGVSSSGDSYFPKRVIIGSNSFQDKFEYTVKSSLKLEMILQFSVPNSVHEFSILDVGAKSYGFIRYTSVPIEIITQSSPSPAQTTAPIASLASARTLTANGVTTFPGVTVNGGVFDVTLFGCQYTSGNTAGCTLALTPLQTQAQAAGGVTVQVGNQTAAASAKSYPAVSVLYVTANVTGGKIDVLQVGNARFTGVVVR